jgi:hypothetical protein
MEEEGSFALCMPSELEEGMNFHKEKLLFFGWYIRADLKEELFKKKIHNK